MASGQGYYLSYNQSIKIILCCARPHGAGVCFSKVGAESQLSNWNPLFFKSWSFNMLLMLEKPRGFQSLMVHAEPSALRRYKGGCRDGALVRALASHQCGPGSIPRSGVICGLSLLVLFSALRGFLRVLRFSLSSKNQRTTWFVLVVSLISLGILVCIC